MYDSRHSIAYVILHFGESSVTNRCLRTVPVSHSSGEIIVVDNGWDFVPDSRSRELAFQLVRPGVWNPGFSRGMNVGAAAAVSTGRGGPGILVFLNNDLELPSRFEEWLRDATSRYPRAGAIGPTVVFRDTPNIIWSAGGSLSRMKGKYTQSSFGDRFRQGGDFRDTDFLSGACLAVRREAFDRVGGWDEDYFFGGEEWDLSSRLRAAGWSLIVDDSFAVSHAASRVTGQGASHDVQDPEWVINGYINRIIFSGKHIGRLHAFLLRCALALALATKWSWRWRRRYGVCSSLALGAKSARRVLVHRGRAPHVSDHRQALCL